MGSVATLEALTQAVALDGLGNDYRRLPLMAGCGLICGVDLVVVVTSALERPDLVVTHVGNQLCGPWVACEEVLANKSSVFSLVGLVVAIGSLVHQIYKSSVVIFRK